MNEKKMSANKYPYKEFGEWVRNQHVSRSQEWLANQLGVSRPFVNLVENGKKRFSPYHVSQLAVMYGGSIDDLALMTGWGYLELEEKYNQASLLHTSASNLILQGQKEIELAEQARESGKPDLAIGQLFFWIDHLEKRIKSDRDISIEIKDMKRILIRAYCMRMISNVDIQPWANVVSSIKYDFSQSIVLASEINDTEGSAMAYSWLADAHYVSGDYKKAKEYAVIALPSLKKDTTIYSETLRDLILINARLNDMNEFQTYINISKEEIENGNITSPTDIATLLEGIAKSKIHLGDMDAIFLLEEAEKEMQILNEKKKNRPVIHMQIHRTKLEYLTKMESLGLTLDQRIVNEFAGKAKGSIKTLPEYARHKVEINSLINRLEKKAQHLRPLQESEQLKLF